VIDCMAEENGSIGYLLGKLEDIAPHLVITAVSTPTFSNDIKVINLIKDRIDTHVSVTGMHTTIFPDKALADPKIDSVIRGEPEMTSLELAKALFNKRGLGSINGLSYKHTGKVLHNPDRPLIENLDLLPFPAREMLNIKRYCLPMNLRPYTFIIPSRGCWHDCVFCQVKNYYGKQLRLRNIGNIISEVEEVVRKLDIKNIAILSDNFTLKRDFVVQFCEGLIEKKLNISWMANSRVDTVDYPLLSLMKKAGCYGLSYGVESGSQDILDRAKKNITIAQIEKSFYWTHKTGIRTLAQVILGLPGETRNTIKRTLDLLVKINPDFVQFNCAVPYPGTGLYKLAIEKNNIREDSWELFEPSLAFPSADGLSAKEIKRQRMICYLMFYCRPRYLTKLFKMLGKDIKISRTIAVALIKFIKEWILNN